MSKINFTVRELLEKVSIGQMIKLIFLYDDGDEVGTFMFFENDKLDLKLPGVKKYLDSNVEFISTEEEFLRIEVFY